MFDGNSVCLGMERSAVENAIGTGQITYSFLNISIGVYREIRPLDVMEMIEEMKADGILTEDNEDVIADMRRANHWATIGVGIRGYYQR